MKKIYFSILLFVLLVTISLITMGLLDRFLWNRSSNESQKPTVTHTENWTTYLTRMEGDHVGSIVIDLGLRSIAPVSGHPVRTTVDVTFLFPTENGFPSENEFEKLASIEESIDKSLVAATGAIYIGHLYAAGSGSLYFYTPDGAKIETAVQEAMQAFPDYPFKVRVTSDPEWDGYRSLYPSPLDMQRIQNQTLIQNLISHGDKLDRERQVDHWIYFPTVSDRHEFVEKILPQRFKVEGEDEVEAVEGKRFQLHISRLDSVTVEATDKYILELWKLAEECNGIYDGWETFVVRE